MPRCIGTRAIATPPISRRNLSNLSGKFRFYGVAAHAAQAPEQGRSALDGVEAMNFMVNALREHVPQDTRIHYVITNGGAAPNVVPEFAEVYYYVRHVDPSVARSVMVRVSQAADGAALGTGTRVEFEQTGGTYGLLPNDTLGRLMDASLREVGAPQWNESEVAFGRQIRATLTDQAQSESGWREIEAYAVDDLLYSSTDVGDVSWVTPTVRPGSRDLGSRHAVAQLASRGGERHEHRHQGRRRRGKGDRAHRAKALRGRQANRGGQSRARETSRHGLHLRRARRRSRAAARLSRHRRPIDIGTEPAPVDVTAVLLAARNGLLLPAVESQGRDREQRFARRSRLHSSGKP